MTKAYLQIEACTSEALVLAFEKKVSKLIDEKISKLHPPVDEDRYLTRQEVAKMFQVSIPTIHNLMNANILKAYKIGHKTRFLLSEVKAAAIYYQTKKAENNV